MASNQSSFERNREAWNRLVDAGNLWTRPVSSQVIADARRGDWSVLLTPSKPVPREWFGDLRGKSVLGLASGGGQQCPIFAAAGAEVTSFDASERQLESDRMVAERDGLEMRTVQGDMRDLSAFADGSFDLVFNPVSTCFVEEVESVWREVARVLKPGGCLLAGFVQPWFYLLDFEAFDRGELVFSSRRLPAVVETEDTVEFSHTFETLIGGQLRAGLVMVDFYEDEWAEWGALYGTAPSTFATRAIRRSE